MCGGWDGVEAGDLYEGDVFWWDERGFGVGCLSFGFGDGCEQWDFCSFAGFHAASSDSV